MSKQRKKTEKNQRSHKQLLLIALGITVSLIVLAFGGYYGYKYLGEQKQKAKTEATQSIEESNVGYSGKELKPPTTFGLFPWSIVIPDGWKVEEINILGLVFADDINYQPGTPFEFVEPAVDKEFYRFSVGYQDTADIPKQYESHKKTAYSNGQLKGYRLYREFSAGEEYASSIMKAGEKHYNYFLIDGDTTWAVAYRVLPGDKDQHDLIEKVVRSIRVQPRPTDKSDL